MLIKLQMELLLITYTYHKKHMYINPLFDPLLMAVRRFNKTRACCLVLIFSEGKLLFSENPKLISDTPPSSFF